MKRSESRVDWPLEHCPRLRIGWSVAVLSMAALLTGCDQSEPASGSLATSAPEAQAAAAIAEPGAEPETMSAVAIRGPEPARTDAEGSRAAAPATSESAALHRTEADGGRRTPQSATTPIAAAGTSPSPDRSGPPRLALERPILHLGRMREDQVRTGEIRFSNEGGETLNIIDVRATCGCTTTALTTRRLAPGESTSINVTFDPGGPGAAQRKFVNIISNSLGESTHVTQVAIEADVEPLIVVEPRILNVGIVRLGEGLRTRFDVGFLNDTFRITEVNTTNPMVRARVLPERILPGPGSEAGAMAHGATVEVNVLAGAQWGSLFSWVELKVSGRPDPSGPVVPYEPRFRVQGQVFGEVIANPDTFRFGAEPNTAFEREITLTHRDGIPFNVELQELNFPGMTTSTIEIVQRRPDQYVVILRAPGASVERQYQGLVHLRTDIPGEEVIDLRIVGVVRPTPITSGR